MNGPRFLRSAFRAMGTDVSVLTPDDAPHAAVVATVRATFESEEQRCSRFRDDSELSRVNRAAGTWTEVSEGFEDLVRFALAQARATQGRFDPTMLAAIRAAGYDRDYGGLARGPVHAAGAPVPGGGWRGVRIERGRVRLPAGVGLDLGGVAKGWTVDLAAREALRAGARWALVNAGGDLRVVGDAPALDVAIEDPADREAEALRLRLVSGGLATSSIRARTWGEGRHHLIDPETGAPADDAVIQASVWARTCAEAETRATWALLTGPAALRCVAGAIVTREGDLLASFPAEAVAA
jgi:thiamine biosynthesis lipoprotein